MQSCGCGVRSSVESAIRLVDELEEDVGGRKQAADRVTQHGAAAGGFARVVAGRSGPSAE